MIGLKEKSPCVSSIIVYKGENLIPPKGWGEGVKTAMRGKRGVEGKGMSENVREGGRIKKGWG